MTDTNAAPAADDGSGIPADLLADNQGNPPPQTNGEDDGFARRLGWRPKDEYLKYGGREDKWVTADAYLEKVQKETPILRERLRTQDSVIQRMETELKETKRLASEQGEALKELLDRSRGAEDRGWQFTRDNIKAGMRKAAAEADTATYQQLEYDLDVLDRNRPPQGKPAAQQKAAAGDQPAAQANAARDPAVDAWMADNRWFLYDADLHRAAKAVEEGLYSKYPDTATRLGKVSEEVKRLFPDKFDNPARKQPTTVSTPSGQAARTPKPKTKTVADLPEDAKLALARIKRRDPKFTDDDYLKHYQWD